MKYSNTKTCEKCRFAVQDTNIPRDYLRCANAMSPHDRTAVKRDFSCKKFEAPDTKTAPLF